MKMRPPIRRTAGAAAIVACVLPSTASTAPLFAGASRAKNSATSSSLVLPAPKTAHANDLLVAAVNVRLPHPKIVAPRGWMLIRRDSIKGPALTQAVYYKVGSLSEPGSYRWSFTGDASAAGGIVAYRGADTKAPIAGASGRSSARTRRIVVPSIRINTPNVRVVAFFGSPGRVKMTPPAGVAIRYRVSSASPKRRGARSEAADFVKVAPGRTPAKVARTRRRAGGIGQVVALRAAGSSVPGPPAPGPPPPSPPPPPPPPPGPPAPPGEILFSGDFEAGNLSQWTRRQCELESWPVNVVTAPVRQGRYSARFEVRTGDGNQDYESTTDDSCELTYRRLITLGQDNYYGQSILFPSDWRLPHRFGVLTQYNYPGLTGPPIALINNRENVLELNIETGHVENEPCSGYCNASYTRRLTLLPSLNKGKWNDIILHVRWATGSTGLVEAWTRVEGQTDFTKVVALTDIPTMQWREGELERSGIDPSTGREHDSIDKIGIYRGRLAGQPPSILWHDGFRRANGFGVIRGGFGQVSTPFELPYWP